MRILVVEHADLSNERIQRMFAHRHQVFVDRLGWGALRQADALERDALDGPNAVYLIATDAAGQLRGSTRLLPTTAPHLFSTVFGASAPRGYGPRPDVWEWSRHAPGRSDWPFDVNEAARFALHLGVCEFGLARGVTAFVALIETRLVRYARLLGWDCEPIGPPTPYAEGEAVAVRNAVTEETLARLRRSTGISHSVLQHSPAFGEITA